MFKNLNTTVLLLIFIACMGLGVYAGYKLHLEREAQVITEIEYRYDTSKHSIDVPEVNPDTILPPITREQGTVQDPLALRALPLKGNTIQDRIDTAAILKAYFSRFVYNREFGDSILSVKLRDTISQNRPGEGSFSYQILRPQAISTTKTSITNYSRYVAVGISFNTTDPKLTAPEIVFTGPKGYLAAGYMPWAKGVNLRAGWTIFKLKSK